MIPPCPLHLHPTRMSETLLDISSFYSDNLHIVLQFRYFNIWQIPVWTIFIYFEVPSTFNPVALLNCGYIWCFPWFLGGNKIMPCCIKIRRCCPSSIILLWLHNVGVVGVESLISAEVFSCCGSPSSQWFTEVCCCREVRSHGVNIE